MLMAQEWGQLKGEGEVEVVVSTKRYEEMCVYLYY